MSASFPETKKTFTAIVDGVTYVEAVNVNTVYDEVEAIQTYLGASGEAQSKNASLINAFRTMIDNIPRLTWIDEDTVEIEAKAVVMFDGNDYVIKRNASAIQIELSADLDTGSEAAQETYYIWLTGDGSSTTYSAVFSTSDSAPSGITYAKLIGKVYNDDSSDLIESSLHSIDEDDNSLTEGFGAWETEDLEGDAFAFDTTYQAFTDGFVVIGDDGTGHADGYHFFTDGSSSPTTRRSHHGDYSVTSNRVSMSIHPVRRGDYWKAEDASTSSHLTIYWLPLK